MKRSAARLLRIALVGALALGVVVLPSLTRCVDAAGHDAIELSNADCCVGPDAADVEHAGACIGGCFDARLVVPSLSRAPQAKQVAAAPLPMTPLAFAAPEPLDLEAVPSLPRSVLRGSCSAHVSYSRLTSVLRC